MLRIRLQRCQGVPRHCRSVRSVPADGHPCRLNIGRNQVSGIAGRTEPENRARAFTRNSSQLSPAHRPVSSIMLSTWVLLTRTVVRPILQGFGHCPTYQRRRKLIETMGRESVYRFVTGSAYELLDIATLRNTMPPG